MLLVAMVMLLRADRTNGAKARRPAATMLTVGALLAAGALPASARAPDKLFGRSFAVLGAAGPADQVALVIGCPDFEDPNRKGRVLLVAAKDGALRREYPARDLDGYGDEVCSAGDLDGDGIEDFAVGAVDWKGAAPSAVHVHSTARDEPIFTWRAERAGGSPGITLAGVGDLDDDGHPDLAYRFEGGAQDERWRSALVFRSGRTGEVLLERGSKEGRVSHGKRVHPLGDLNGDGRADLAITVEGPHATDSFVELYSGLEVRAWLTLRGDERNALFGNSICVVPDLDGDGREDLAVGSWDFDGAEGRVTLHASSDGRLLAARAEPRIPGFGRSVALRDHAGSRVTLLVGADELGISTGGLVELTLPGGEARLVLRGDSNDHHVGSSIARICDLDGDGAPDFVVGNDHSQGGVPGRIRVVSGASYETLRLIEPASLRGR